MVRLVAAYLTFPGVIVHEYGHAWACHRLGIRVLKVCYLRLGNPLGYVSHEQPKFALHHIVIATAPFFVSTCTAMAIGALCGLLGAFPATIEIYPAVMPLAVWLSFSIAFHAFPSSGDGDALWNDVNSPGISIFAKLLLVPVVGLIRLSRYCAIIWIDVLFAIIVTAAPHLAVMAALT